MDRKISLLTLTWFTGMLWIAGCSTGGIAVPTNIPSPTIALTSPSIPTPTLAPTVPVSERFPESVSHWRVAYYDRALDQLCAMDVDGSSQACLDFDQYPDIYLYGTSAASPDGTYGFRVAITSYTKTRA